MTGDVSARLTLWSGWELGAKPKRTAAATRYGVRRNALHRLAKKNPDLAAGSSVPPMPAEEIDALLREVCPHTGHAQFRTAYNFLLAGLANGVRELGWDLELPAPIHRLRPSVSRFPLGDYESLTILREIKNRLLATITDPRCYQQDENIYLKRRRIRQKKGAPPNDVRAMHMGHVLLSAILFGAVLKKRVLFALLRELQDEGPEISGEILWFSLGIPARKSDTDAELENATETHFRRCFPDPVTGLLALRFLKTYGEQTKRPLPTIQKMLTLALGSIGTPLDSLPRLPALLRLATLDHRLRLAPSLVEYATREFETRSLPPSAWARLRHGVRLQTTEVTAELSVMKNPPKRCFDTVTNGQDQSKCLRAVREAIKDLRRARTKGRKRYPKLRQVRTSESLCPILYYLVLWIEHLADRDKRGERPLATSTIATYFSRIGPRLVAHGLEFSVAEADEESFDELYSVVLGDTGTDGNRRRVVEQLQSFHNFLRDRYGAPDIEFDLQGGQLASVDTNIVTQREYAQARELLSARPNTSSFLKEMQDIALMLGFRAGMRRSEIQYLRLRDIQVLRFEQGPRQGEIREVEIILRAHAQRGLKSAAARRRLPLHILLGAEELAVFTKFVERRYQRTGWPKNNHNALLFSAAGDHTLALSNAELFEPITMALRAASGDDSLRFHHLRHSFANRLLASLWNARHPRVLTEKWLKVAHENEESVRHLSRNWWECFIGTEPDSPSRKALFALGLTMGHAEPTATLQSYVHMIDVILGASLEYHAPDLDVGAQALLLDVPTPSWRVFRSRSKIVGNSLVPAYEWATRRAAKSHAERVPARMTNAPPEALPPPSSIRLMETRPRMAEVYDAVALLATSKIDNTSLYERAKLLEARTGYDAKTVLAWHRKARHLSSIKTARKRPIHSVMHRGSQISVDRRSSVPGVTPGPPHLQVLVKEAERVYDAILENWDGGELEALMRSGTDLILHNGSFYRTMFRVPRLDDIRTCIAFLEAVEISRDRLCVFVPGISRSDGKSPSWLWGEFLGLSASQIQGNGAADEAKVDQLDASTSGRPISPRGASISVALASHEGNDRPRSAMRAIRYGCFMARVVTS